MPLEEVMAGKNWRVDNVTCIGQGGIWPKLSSVARIQETMDEVGVLDSINPPSDVLAAIMMHCNIWSSL